MKRTLFTTVIFIFSFQAIAFCQNENAVISNVVSKLKALTVDHITEKAYLHFDRPYSFYTAGETIYFKAYVTMGERHELSNISGILHVDLIGKNNIFMQSIALQLNNGTGCGDFKLADTLQKGTYRIRAYTEWMRNEKSPNFFERYISVSSVNNVDRVAEAVKQGNQPGLQFFPEGGNLVTDIHSKVAFKAIGPDGLGINVKGIVFDDQNKAIAKIASSHLGMGVFDFIPEAGRAYKAKVTFANGSQSTVELPAIETKGITLDVINNPDKISIEINANRDYYKENQNKDLNMMIYCAGKIRTYSFKLDNSVLGVDLPVSDFQTGILQVTLLSATGEPMNERLAFIQNQDLLNLSVNTNKPSFTKRENVQLSLNAKNKEGNAVNGYFSVSVVDESKILVDEDSENSILSYLLLTSDLKGYIEKPNYYFAHVTKETRADLDALMLTQGYRRFVWKQLLNDNPMATNTFMPEKHIDIAGVLKTKTGEPIINSSILLIEKGSGTTLLQQTDTQGRFRFANVDFFSDTHFLLKMQSSFGKNGAVVVLDNPAPGPEINNGNLIEAKYNANADILASLQNNQGMGIVTASNESTKVLLQNDKGAVPANHRDNNYRSTKLGGSGNADQVIRADQILPGPSLSDGIKGIARGVDFTNGVPHLQSSMTVTAGAMGSEAMLILMDGTAITNIDNVNLGDVESIEILKGPNASIYGLRGASGVIIINTKQISTQTGISKEMAPGLFSITPPGFYKSREFYSPNYDAIQPESQSPRTTIFWKPDVATDANGNASLSYFNAEAAGPYRVVVEGIDGKGNLGRQVFHYKVE